MEPFPAPVRVVEFRGWTLDGPGFEPGEVIGSSKEKLESIAEAVNASGAFREPGKD